MVVGIDIGYGVYCEPRDHHREMTFEKEFRTLLQKHGTPLNERSARGLIHLELARLSGRAFDWMFSRG
jgi:hypothetical protein